MIPEGFVRINTIIEEILEEKNLEFKDLEKIGEFKALMKKRRVDKLIDFKHIEDIEFLEMLEAYAYKEEIELKRLKEEEELKLSLLINKDSKRLQHIHKNRGKSFKTKVKQIELEQMKYHLNAIYKELSDNNRIFVTYKNIHDPLVMHSWSFMLKDLNEDLVKRLLVLGRNHDVYFTQNSFYGIKRLSSQCSGSNCFILDLDYYNEPELSQKTPEEMQEHLISVGAFEKIEPSYIISSGRGLSLVFLTDRLLVQNSNILFLRRQIVDNILKHFKPYGADFSGSDLARVNRVPGIINTKSGNKAYILDFDPTKNPKRYTLSELMDKLVPKKEKKEKVQAIKPIKAREDKKRLSPGLKVVFTKRTLGYQRAMDLQRIALKRRVISEGYRNVFYHLYALFLAQSGKNIEAIEQVLTYHNNNQKNSLSTSEISNITHQAYKNKGKYNYGNDRIIELLEIDKEDMKDLKTIISQKEKNRRKNEKRYIDRRNKEGLTKRQQAYEDRLLTINNLLKLDTSKKEIAKILDISIKTVERFIKEIDNRKLNEYISFVK